VALASAMLAACHDEHWLTYPWDDRRVLCSQTMDDMTETAPWDLAEEQMQIAERTDAVALFHMHNPEHTVSIAAIQRILRMAEHHNLAFLTYRDLDAAVEPRAGLALAFDDNSIGAWFGVRDILAAHGARVTYFVTRWYSRSDEERAELQQLADDGHDVEPHSVNHLHARDYVRDHGLAGYLSDEFQPSIDGLVGAGYPPPTVYAYPFGEASDELNAAILQVVPRVRVSPGSCPH
jgi:hypothetical protein